ncbi:hypothetical protein PR048_007635 [Dryococelus australis]|uniref:Uncharacterized protein n=1 Tax=Dryococelus australis TaxID=614101 RepID=A0ABQ9HUT5_9NEOP|nr:hypothetical protein PR048_007635 [Dryococelus australis]
MFYVFSISEEESTEASYHDDLNREATSSPPTTAPTTTTTTTTTTSTTTSRPFFFTTSSREQFLPTVTSPPEDDDHPYGIHGLHAYQPPRVKINKPGQSGFHSGSPASTQHSDDHHPQYLNNRFTSTTHAPTHVFNIQNNGPSGFSITSTSRPNSFNSNPFAERDSSQEYHRPFPSVSPGFINHQLSRPSAPSYTTTRRSPFSSSHNPNGQSPIVHAAQNLRTKISTGNDDLSGHQGVQPHSHNPLAFDFGSQQQGLHIHTTPSVAVVATTISTSRSTNSKGFFFKPQAGATNYSDHFRLSPVVSVNLTVSSPQFTETSIPPSSYDEYQEHDVHTDPFFKDVPRVGGARSNPAERGFERHKRGTDSVKKSDNTSIKTKKQVHHHNKVSHRHEHSQKKKKSPAWVHEDFESIARRISEVTRSRAYMYPVAHGDGNERPSVEDRRRRTTVGSGKRVSHAPLKCSSGVGKDRCTSPGRRDIPRRRSTRQVDSGYYSGDTVPMTTFTCKDKIPGGYYADLETDCQLFHICSQGRHGR